MKLTKTEMARVIVAALFNLPGLPPEDHHAVKRWARLPAPELRDHHRRALAAIRSVQDRASA